MSARAKSMYYPELGRAGHLFDFAITTVTCSPGGEEELNLISSALWRYLYPYELVATIRENKVGKKGVID